MTPAELIDALKYSAKCDSPTLTRTSAGEMYAAALELQRLNLELAKAVDAAKAQATSLQGQLTAEMMNARALDAKLADRARERDELRSFLEMYAAAWQRELGGLLISKPHRIDALVLTTRWALAERTERAESIACGWAFELQRDRCATIGHEPVEIIDEVDEGPDLVERRSVEWLCNHCGEAVPDPLAEPERADPYADREPTCVERWPECFIGGYDPRCCRFPKSCSCWVNPKATK